MLRYGEIYSALISKARKMHLFIERFVRESKENKTGKTMKGCPDARASGAYDRSKILSACFYP